ncbi:unnamed protein product, partial [Prorocentrum cordatum]
AVRALRTTEKTAGSDYTREEMTAHKEGILSFVQKRQRQTDAGPAVAAKRAKKLKEEPRMASFDWLCCVETALRGMGRTLLGWIPTEADDPDAPWPAHQQLPACLTTVMDQEQKQWCAAYYLSYKCQGQFVRLFGHMHRRCNDVDRGLQLAGVYGTCLLRLFEANIAYGPWVSGQYFEELQDMARTLVKAMTPDDPLLLKLRPQICNDHGWAQPWETDASARQRFVAGFAAEAPFQIKGSKAAAKRWFSILKSMREGDKHYHTKLLALAAIAQAKGWAEHWGDLWNPGPRLAAACQLQLGAASVAVGGAPGSANSSAPAVAKGKSGAAAKPVTAAKAKASAKQKVAAVMTGSANHVHSLAKVMANPELIVKSRMVQCVAGPFEIEHAGATDMRGADATLAYYVGVANGSWLDTLKSSFKSLSNVEKLKQIGLTVEFDPELRGQLSAAHPAVACQGAVATEMMHIFACIASERSASMAGCTRSYPHALAPIAGADWNALCKARRVKSPIIEPMVERNSLNVRPMRDFCRFAASVNWELHPSIVAFVRRLFSGFGNDKLVEDSLGTVRDSEARAPASKHMAPWRVWQAPRQHGVLAQYDMEEIDTDGVVPIADIGDVSCIFTGQVVAEDALAKLRGIRGEQTWMTFDAMSARRQPADHHLHRVLASDENWPLSNTAWRSALVPERVFVCLKDPEPKVFLVLYSCESALLGWPAVRSAGTQYVSLDAHAPKLVWHTVHDFEAVTVLPHSVVSPLRAFLDGSLTSTNMGLLTKLAEPVPLLDYLCSVGFAGVSEGLMKKLFGLRKAAAPQECVGGLDYETSLAVCLMKEIKPTMTQEESHLALQKRIGHKAEEDWTEHINIDDVEKVVSSGDKDQLKKFDAGQQANKALREALHSALEAVTKDMFKKGPAAKGAAKKPVAAPNAASWWATVRGDPAWLEKNRPPVGSVHVDDIAGRFQLAYPGQGTKSVAWTRRGMELANVEACRVLWSWHCK